MKNHSENEGTKIYSISSAKNILKDYGTKVYNLSNNSEIKIKKKKKNTK